jgi:hypothetical protein
MKNCIFICAFLNVNYIKLLELLLNSIHKYGNLNRNTEILIYTNSLFVNQIKNMGVYKKLQINFETNDKLCEFNKTFETRLDFFKLPSSSRYDKVLYLDTDVLINGELNEVFNIVEKEILYVVEEATIYTPGFGHTLFTDEEKRNYPNGSAFNSGVILFKNCETIKNLFENIVNEINRCRNLQQHLFDQPYVIHNAIINKLFDNQIMKKYSTNYNHYENMDKVIQHFAGGPGEHTPKLEKMGNFAAHQISFHGR